METRKIKIGKVEIGGGAPIAIQSMTNTDTADVTATLEQIHRLERAGCEIVRVAAYDETSAKAITALKAGTALPIVADVHFDADIAIWAMEAGADKVRINPGNIGSEAKVRRVADAARAHHIPLRVGANTGSLASAYRDLPPHQALVKSALENIAALERAGFFDIVVSLKASHVKTAVLAYRQMAKLVDYPLHLGITEAGIFRASLVKSSMGIGALLLDGIGDTIRVSITGDPVEEVAAAKDILRYAGLRHFGIEVIACPTCGRTRIDVVGMAQAVEEMVAGVDKPLKIAVMGCAVNGPGEARDADIGIAGGKGEGLIFKKGVVYKKLPEEQLLGELKRLIEEF